MDDGGCPSKCCLTMVKTFLGTLLVAQDTQYSSVMLWGTVMGWWRVLCPDRADPCSKSSQLLWTALYIIVHVICHASLGTRPSENRKEGLGDRLGWKCTERNVWNLYLLFVPTLFLELLAIRVPKLFSNNSRQQILLFSVFLNYTSMLRFVFPVNAHKHMQTWTNWKCACILGAQYTSTPTYLPDPLSNFPRAWFWDKCHTLSLTSFPGSPLHAGQGGAWEHGCGLGTRLWT